MSPSRPVAMMLRIGDTWIVRVPGPGGAYQEFRCTTEAQARQLIAPYATRTSGPGAPAR